ncbi:hypothetical protein CHUAL_008761 [Chamberlinius hualienensis]
MRSFMVCPVGTQSPASPAVDKRDESSFEVIKPVSTLAFCCDCDGKNVFSNNKPTFTSNQHVALAFLIHSAVFKGGHKKRILNAIQ